MEKNYEAFLTELHRGLVLTGKLEEKDISFAKKGEKYAKNGDRMFVVCAVHEDTRELCGIYTEELYDRYIRGTEMHRLIADIMAEIAYARESGFFESTRKLSSYEQSRKYLFIRLLNAEQHRLDLEQAVFWSVGDIALVLYMKVGENENCITSIKMRRDYIEYWDMEPEVVFKEALMNTYRISPPRIFFWEKLLYDEYYTGDSFVGQMDFPLIRDARGNCLSTEVRTNGAVAAFLPGVADFLSELMGGDLYLVFTSIHEVMVHNAREVTCEELADVLADTIEEATPEEDYLTSSIYKYSRSDRKISCVCKRPLRNTGKVQ